MSFFFFRQKVQTTVAQLYKIHTHTHTQQQQRTHTHRVASRLASAWRRSLLSTLCFFFFFVVVVAAKLRLAPRKPCMVSATCCLLIRLLHSRCFCLIFPSVFFTRLSLFCFYFFFIFAFFFIILPTRQCSPLPLPNAFPHVSFAA